VTVNGNDGSREGKMNLQEEIARLAFELFERSGRTEGRNLENWLDAERIVLSRHASQDIEEPEGEEPLIAEEIVALEVEGTEIGRAGREKEEETTVMEEIEARGQFTPGGKAVGMTGVAKKSKPAKKGGAGNKTPLKGAASRRKA
jgi:hypothetical protein